METTHALTNAFPLQVVSTVQSFLEVIRITDDVWWGMPLNVFEAAWIVTGYYQGKEHFSKFRDAGVADFKEASHLLDPTQILASTQLRPTPQYCTVFEWQLQDRLQLEVLAILDYQPLLVGDVGFQSAR